MVTIDRRRLAAMPYFRNADDDTLDAVLKAGVTRRFAAGETLMEEGSHGSDMYLLIEGRVDVLKLQDDALISVGERHAGELVGEMALIDSGERSATVKAKEPIVALEFSMQDLRAVWARDPDLMYQMVQGLTARLRQADQKMIADLTFKNRELAAAYAELESAQSALIEKERLERELELARQLQRSMLPQRFPDLPGFAIAALSRPAREVGGDLYDVIADQSDHAIFLIADVSDKGMPAALYMALTRSLIRAEAKRCRSPREVLLRTHELLLEISHTSMFFTAFCGILDLRTRKLTYARAGHDRPLLRRGADGSCEWLDARGMLLGLMPEVTLSEAEVQLHGGDALILYTDGMTDTNNPRGDFFGEEGLEDAVRAASDYSAQGLCEHLFASVERFRDGTAQFDDIALMVLAVEE